MRQGRKEVWIVGRDSSSAFRGWIEALRRQVEKLCRGRFHEQPARDGVADHTVSRRVSILKVPGEQRSYRYADRQSRVLEGRVVTYAPNELVYHLVTFKTNLVDSGGCCLCVVQLWCNGWHVIGGG